MAVPKSVIKVKRGNVTYISNVDKVNYTIKELTKRALNDVGKYICTKTRYDFKTLLKHLVKNRKMDKRLFNSFQWWYRPKEKDVLIGIKVFPNKTNPTLKATRTEKRKGKKKNQLWYAEGQEIGIGGMKKYGLLTSTVMQNIDIIRDIEGKYLSYIDDERKALRVIEEVEKEDETS